ncbi:MAG: hypothetical protein KGL39_09205 [Patescibacteria group bacterium]|nr:hypothetical protein [Patescibacteria group bacterium]
MNDSPIQALATPPPPPAASPGTTPVPQPQPGAPPSSQPLQAQREAAAQALNGMLSSLWRNLHYSLTPGGAVEDAADILGSPQRAVGRIVQGVEAHKNPAAITRDVVGGVFHPGDTDAQGRDVLAQETDAIRALVHAPTHEAINSFVQAHVPPELAGLVSGLLRFGEDFLLQSASDPFNLAYGAGALVRVAHLAALVRPMLRGAQTAKAMAWIVRSHDALSAMPWLSRVADAYGQVLHGAGQAFHSEPELSRVLTDSGRKLKFQIDNAASLRGDRLAAEDAHLFAHGTGSDLSDRYVLYQSQLAGRHGSTTAAQVTRWRHTFAAMTPEEQRAAVDAVRAKEVRASRTHMLARELQNANGYRPGTAPMDAKAWDAWTRRHPGMTQWLDQHAVGRVLRAVASPMRSLLTASLFLNPLPHGARNVGELVALGSSSTIHTVTHALGDLAKDTFHEAWGNAVRAVGRRDWEGVQRELGKIALPPAMRNRLEAAGSRATYTHDLSKMLLARVPGIGPVWKGAVAPLQHFLTSIEDHWRYGLLEEADRKFGPSRSVADELTKGAYVNDIAGDYQHAGVAADLFSAFGGPWTAFRLGIVPRAMMRVLSTTEGRAKLTSFYRAQQDLQHARSPQAQAQNYLTLGGPPEDFAKLGAASAQLLVGNPSELLYYGTAGSGPIEAAAGDQSRSGPRVAQNAARMAQSINPLRSPLESVAALRGQSRPLPGYSNTYAPTMLAERLLDSMLSAFGSYYQKKQVITRTSMMKEHYAEADQLKILRALFGLPP